MFEQVFKNIDEALRNDSGCNTELDYAEQSSWILFLKWLDDYEIEKEKKSSLDNKVYIPLIEEKFRWSSWAVIKNNDGTINYNKSLTGQDLKKLVDDKVFPYLSSFKDKAASINSLEYKIGEIFFEIKNKIEDGYSLREIINEVDKLDFRSNKQKYELSFLYEEKIKRMGNAGRNGGEYYTPRALIRSMIRIINPKIGETIYDGAVGSAGFLVEAFEYIKNSKTLTTSELKILETQTLYGAEKKSLAYTIGIMNMILHGIESPNIIRQNTLETKINEIQTKAKMDIILANPPFGGSEKTNIKQNFPIKSSETAILFLQYFFKKMKNNGRAAIVIKKTFLSINNNAYNSVRKELIENFNLEYILYLPASIFTGTPRETVVLFFKKSAKTENIWFYEMKLEKTLGKKNPLTEKHLMDFEKKIKSRELSKNSWRVNYKDINKKSYHLLFDNPREPKDFQLRNRSEIFDLIKSNNKKIIKNFENI